ncbi:MAG: hypothetical protein EBZ89_07865 [Chloroflexi bacterium]|nr:hypothetical protein [Chloroflexota bacterium]
MIKHKPDPTAVIRALRSAAPYIRLFKGKTFVVKAGGGVFGDPEATRALIEQVAILHSLGVKVVFVEQYAPARRAHVLQAVDLFRMPAHAADKSGQVTANRRAVGNRRPSAGIT